MDVKRLRSLLEELISTEYEDCDSACDELISAGIILPQAKSTLSGAYYNRGKKEIEAYLDLLKRITPSLLAQKSCLPILLEELQSRDVVRQLAAATVLLALGAKYYHHHKEVFDLFVKLLRKSSDRKIRELAIWLLQPFNERAREVLVPIACDAELYHTALTALGLPGPSAQAGLPALVAALSVTNPCRQIKDHPAVHLIPEKATDALRNLGPQAHIAIPDILKKEKHAFISTRFLIWQAMPELRPQESPHHDEVARAFASSLPSLFSYCEDLEYSDSVILNIAKALWPLSLTGLIASSRSDCRELAFELLRADDTKLDDQAELLLTNSLDIHWPGTFVQLFDLLHNECLDKKRIHALLERFADKKEISPQALAGLTHALVNVGKEEYLAKTFSRLASEFLNDDTLLSYLGTFEYLLDNLLQSHDHLKVHQETIISVLLDSLRAPNAKGQTRVAIREESAKFLRHFLPFSPALKEQLKEIRQKIPPSGATKYIRRYLRDD